MNLNTWDTRLTSEKEDRGILGIWFLVKVMMKFLHATILFNLF